MGMGQRVRDHHRYHYSRTHRSGPTVGQGEAIALAAEAGSSNSSASTLLLRPLGQSLLMEERELLVPQTNR